MPTPGVELSLVLPCLDEAETLEACVRKVQDSLHDARVRLSLTHIGEG